MSNKTKLYSGYIEGFYGKVLSWQERNRILKVLHENNFNTYFYAPKDDQVHRFMWKKNFSMSWLTSFKKFAMRAKKYNVKIIAGISPGLDFQYEKNYHKGGDTDFNILCKKLKQLIDFGADSVAVLLDDIPENLINLNDLGLREGLVHSNLINELSHKLSMPIYFVPRVYAFEIEKKGCNYIKDILLNLDNTNPMFFCGENIIQKSIQKNLLFEKFHIAKDNVIFWDNLYANDYSPKKIIIGPWHKRNSDLSIMVNLTGKIEIDILNLFFISQNGTKIDENDIWHRAMEKFRIPYQFLSIKKFFCPKHSFTLQKNDFFNLNQSFYDDLETLLWKWKSPLASEIFPYLLTLKQELEIYNNTIKLNRIVKTQTITLAKILTKKRI